MSYTIAVAGKGGTGKTTLAALIIRSLLNANKKPILAVDADPNSNLNEALGVEAGETIAEIADNVMDKKEDISPGMTKERFLEYHLQDALTESKGFDLLVMGHCEGPGCYCSVNNLLRGFMEKLRKNYGYLVMDNEAGMEHLSRRTTRDVDALLIISTASPVSLRAARRIYEISKRLKLNIKKSYLVMNEMQPGPTGSGRAECPDTPLLGTIPYDAEIQHSSINKTSIFSLTDSPAIIAVKDMVEKLVKN